MPDGYITYSTKLDNKQLEKDLAKATKDVERLEGQMQKNSAKRLPLVEQTTELGAKLDEAKAKMVSHGTAISSYEGGGYSESKENRKRDKEEHKLITKKYMSWQNV